MTNMARVVSVLGGETHVESLVIGLFPQCRNGSQSSRGTRYRRTTTAVSCRNCLDILRWAQMAAIEGNEQYDIKIENAHLAAIEEDKQRTAEGRQNAEIIDGIARKLTAEAIKTLTGGAPMRATLVAVGPDATAEFVARTRESVQELAGSPLMTPEHNGTKEYECTECGHYGNGQVPGCTCRGCDGTKDAPETIGTALPIEACTADANGSPIYAGDAVQFVAYGLIARVGVITRIDGAYAYVRYVGANGSPIRERGIDLLGGGRTLLLKTYSPLALADGEAIGRAEKLARHAYAREAPDNYYSMAHVVHLDRVASALLKAGEIAARAAHIGLACKAPYVLCEFAALYAETVRQEGMTAVRRAAHIYEALNGEVAEEDRRARLGEGESS